MNEKEDKKTYEIVGTVEIGTDEYRDLIENAIKYQYESERKSDRYWEKSREFSDLEKKYNSIKKELDLYQAFVNSFETYKTEFASFSTDYKFDEIIEEKS